MSPGPDIPPPDLLLGGRVRLLQPGKGYRAAIDPVLLAAAVPAGEGERVLELGCGAGAASLCLAARVPGCRVTGLEMQAEAAELARRNAALNRLEERFEVVEGDLLRPPGVLRPGGFDRVMANPPFHPAGAHTISPTAGKAASHGEGEAGLADWIAAALRFLKGRGTLTLVHRADRLDEILARLHGRFGAVTVLPLWPMQGREAKRVIVTARRDARSPARLLPGLVLHGAGGAYTPEAERVLRDGVALET
ncbi:MAG TPA: methyltransferase [Azospirillaceae bacterium]|nr:methyltransferase [Azospirillaceae bacterium]